MDNLVEQLRATELEICSKAADTITAQSRLISLAGTLAGAVDKFGDSRSLSDCTEMSRRAHILTAALTEYAQSGTVPCGECEAKREVLRDADKRWAADRRRADRAEEERDDLRRQLEHQTKEANEYGRWLDQAQNERDAARIEADDLRRQLAEAQAHIAEVEASNVSAKGQLDALNVDNAALVEVLTNLHALAEVATEIGPAWLTGQLQNALSQSHPGDPMREELAEVQDELRQSERAVDNWISVTDGWRAKVEPLLTDNAALIEVLREALPLAEGLCAGNINGSFVPASSWPLDPIQRILSQPHPGAAMLEELAALRSGLDRLAGIIPYQHCRTCDLMAQEIDAIRNREAGHGR